MDHRFVHEWGAGSIDDVVRRYLVQDDALVDSLASLVGQALANAQSIVERRHLGTFLETVTNEEHDCFERSFDAQGVPEADRGDPKRAPVTEAFEDLLGRAAGECGYEETLAVSLPAECWYLAWASEVADANPAEIPLAEWIDLHATEDFESFVE